MNLKDLWPGWHDLRDFIAQERRRIRERMGTSEGRALSTFIRPDLGPLPTPLSRLLEPLVAVLAGSVMAFFAALGMLHFGIFFACLSVVYLIITHVFGIELDLNLPT